MVTGAPDELASGASYTEPRLAALYDAFNPWEAYHDFYLALAGAGPIRVLDMGCGTGRLAAALAARGHQVSAADPARAMLDVARHLPGGGKVTWIESDAAGLSVAARFDLIIMTGHAFQTLLRDEDVLGALKSLKRHLAPHGRLAFETRNAAVAEWQEWLPDQTRERRPIDGIGMVELHYDIRAVEGPLVTFETHFRFADGATVAASTLRFMHQPEVAAFLAEAGFENVTWHGDWEKSAFRSDSPEIIAIAA